MSDRFHDFDPYAALEQMSMLLKEISDSHNRLVSDYIEVKKTVVHLENKIRHMELEIAIMNIDNLTKNKS